MDKENDKKKPTIRQVRKSGGSLIVSLTDFVQENDFYIVKKDDDNITLTKLKVEIPIESI